MREIGEQWIKNDRMYKAVEGANCSGCCYNDENQGCYISGQGCPTYNSETDLVVKDLGPVNEDGLLAEERTGLFPVITGLESEKCWVVRLNAGNVTVTVSGNTKQQAKDAWNRRV